MMSHLAPNAEPLAQLVRTIDGSLSNDSNIRVQAYYALEEAKKVPDLYNYLIWILVKSKELSLQTRSGAGLVLKNALRQDHISPEKIEERLHVCKVISLEGLEDESPLIRSISANVITTITTRFGIAAWPQILSYLLQKIDTSAAEGAFDALSKICEDCPRELDKDYNGQVPLSFLIPKLLSHVNAENPKIRQYVLFSLNQLAIAKTNTLNMFIDQYLAALFQLATDASSGVRKTVCSGLVALVEMCPEKLMPSLDSICNYIIYSTQEQDSQVALEACEFWLAIAEEKELCQGLAPHLNRIVPMLLRGMVYTDEDYALLEADEAENNEAVEDRDQDIKPKHARSYVHSQERISDNLGNQKTSKEDENGSNDRNEEDDDDDDDDDDEDETEDDFFSEWNFRKCSAAAFDVFSGIFPNQVLSYALEYFQANIKSEDWKIREACVLALGALAEGCLEGISPHLQELIPYLLTLLHDSKALVRQITCWTLGRYSSWAANMANQDKKYIDAILKGLLNSMLDNNKKVQEAACSALASSEENFGADILMPYIEIICARFIICFQKYKKKNILILYDAIQTLADTVGSALNRPYLIEMLMQPLTKKWHSTSDDDLDLFPLFECMSSLTIAFGSGFEPYAAPVFQRCINILQKTLVQLHSTKEDSDEIPNKDFLITALDLISGLVVGNGSKADQLIRTSNPPLINILSICLQDEYNDVRQSAYALLGDLVINVFYYVEPYIEDYMRGILTVLTMEKEVNHVCNNAIWVSGEIAVKKGRNMYPYTELLLKPIINLINNPESSMTIKENCAIALGRLGLATPELVAPHVETFAQQFLGSLLDVADNDEKESAYRGFCILLSRNPKSLSSFYGMFILAVSSYQQPSSELAGCLGQILQEFKPHCQDWSNVVAGLTIKQREVLSRYII